MSRIRLCAFALLAWIGPGALAPAQSDGSQKENQAPQSTPAEEGVQSGGYLIHQAVEIGGHIVGSSGNRDVYSSFVNLDSGLRLLEHTLSMHAQPGTGLLFDDLAMSSFGYGGDPNNATRLRLSKVRLYDFRGQFRRDRNFFDFNQLANPFNAPVPDPTIFPGENVVTFSPHRMELVRRMTDLDLTLLPQHPVSVRLGYGRNVMEGHSFGSYHEGPDVLLDQPWRMTSNRFRAGLDLNVIPRTRISFNQYFDWFKQDTSADLAFFRFGQLNDASLNGFPLVELGIVLDPTGQPCPAPIANNTVTPVAINPTCGGYIDYRRTNPWRGSHPTSFLSFSSTYWRKAEISGAMSYSSGELNGPFSESFFGRVSRTFHQRFDIAGPVDNRRIAVNADFGLTVHVNDRFRIVDKFDWESFRLPGSFIMEELSQFSSSMAVEANVFNPATCPAIPATCPLYAGNPNNSASPADEIFETFTNFLGQKAKSNLLEAQLDFGRRGGISAGYRVRNRDITVRSVIESLLTYYPGRYATSPAVTSARGECRAGNTHGAIPDPATGICTVALVEGMDPLTGEPESHVFDITEHGFVAGVWLRPADSVRLSYDLDLMKADEIFTRITPETAYQHKLRLVVKPRSWVNLTGTLNFVDQKSNVPSAAIDAAEPDAGVDYDLNIRSYGFIATFFNQDRFSIDVAYDYNSYDSSSTFCFIDTEPPANVVPADPLLCGTATGMQFGTSFWDNRIHFGSANFMYRPTERLTAIFGYTVTASSADTLQTNPFGTPVLGINYHLPSFMLAYKLAERWTIKGGMNHYGYNEKFNPGRTAARDFRANVGTVALRYEF